MPEKHRILANLVHILLEIKLHFIAINLCQYQSMNMVLYYLSSLFGVNYRHFKENYLPGSIPNKKFGS